MSFQEIIPLQEFFIDQLFLFSFKSLKILLFVLNIFLTFYEFLFRILKGVLIFLIFYEFLFLSFKMLFHCFHWKILCHCLHCHRLKRFSAFTRSFDELLDFKSVGLILTAKIFSAFTLSCASDRVFCSKYL